MAVFLRIQFRSEMIDRGFGHVAQRCINANYMEFQAARHRLLSKVFDDIFFVDCR